MSDARWLAQLVEEILAEIERGVVLNGTHHVPQISIAMVRRWRNEKDAALAAKTD